jgi:hypothetical protein
MDHFARIESAASLTNTEPTAGQISAGNYRKGRVSVQGVPVVIENPRNSYREGIDLDGNAWRTRMAAHYGYVPGTVASDGDGVDVFIGPFPESDRVYGIHQVDPKTGEYDEMKMMLGFPDRMQAEQAYNDSYSRDWQGHGGTIACSMSQFKHWLKNADTTKPMTGADLPKDGTMILDAVDWASDAPVPVGVDMADLLYSLRQIDPDGLLLDPMSMPDIVDDAEAEIALDALVIPYNQLARKMQQLQKSLQQTAGDGPTVADMSISKPLRIRSVVNVVVIFELTDGQTITIFFHHGGANPNKVQQQDELISWRWMLNKKDISVLVAKENGQELNPRIIARRVMSLADRNSSRFAKINADRSERLNSIEVLKRTFEEKSKTLQTVLTEVADLTEKITERKAKIAMKASSAAATTIAPQRFVGAPTAELAPMQQHEVVAGVVPHGVPTAAAPVAVLPQAEHAVIAGLGASAEELRMLAQYGSYAAAASDPDMQDVCDHLMNGRIIDVRNALRRRGWTGDNYGKLVREDDAGDVYSLFIESVSPTKYNITNCNFQVNVSKPGQDFSPPAGKVPNDMSKTADSIAAEIDRLTAGPVVQEQANSGEDHAAEQVVMSDDERKKLMELRETLSDFIANSPNSSNVAVWRKKLAEIDDKLGYVQKNPENKEPKKAVDISGFSDSTKRAYALLEEYERSKVDLLEPTKMGAFKRKIRSVAKTIPEDNEKAVFYIDTVVTKVFGVDFDPKRADVEFAPPQAEQEEQSVMTSEAAEQVAKTIAQQLGGNKFKAMTGAKNFVFLPEGGLQFSLPAGSAKNGINLVTITLNPDDEYDIVFYRKRGVAMKEVTRTDGVQASGLRGLFEQETGLATSLTVKPGLSDYSAWEGEVFDIVAEKLECSHGDAEAVVAAQTSAMADAWANKLSPADAAGKVLAAGSDEAAADADIGAGQQDTHIIKAEAGDTDPSFINGPKLNVVGENDDPNAPGEPEQPPAVSPAPMEEGEPLTPAAEGDAPEVEAQADVPNLGANLAAQQAIADADPLETEAANNAEVNAGLPGKSVDMEGSEKQIKWASEIRAKAVSEMEKLADDLKKEGKSEAASAAQSAVSAMNGVKSSKWWIDNRDDFNLKQLPHMLYGNEWNGYASTIIGSHQAFKGTMLKGLGLKDQGKAISSALIELEDEVEDKRIAQYKAKKAASAEPVAPEDPEATQRADDTAYLQSVIDGDVDYMSLDLAERLSAIHDRMNGDSEMADLFNAAAEAYSNRMIQAAKDALA